MQLKQRLEYKMEYRRMTGSMIEKAVQFLNTQLDRDFTTESVEYFCNGNGRLAVLNEQIVGLIFWGFAENGRLTICQIGVDAAYRRQKIASTLIMQMLVFLNHPTIYLQVDQTNDAAIQLYKSFNFYVIENWQDYYGPGKHAWYMKRNGR